MNDLRKAAQQALDTMGKLTTYDIRPSSIWRYFYASATGDYVNLREFKELAEPICTDLKAALAEPVQEPLTEEEIENLGPLSFTWRDMVQFARAIERAHGIGGEE